MQNTEKALGAWNAGPFASPWRLLDEVFGNAAPARNRGFAPPVDVSETPEEYVVTAELPGTKPEDVTVELNDGILTMRGEKRIERDELIEQYARRSGRDVGEVDFYRVLGLYKLAVISEGIYARFRQGKTVGEGFENLQRSSVGLARRALAVADASSSRALRGA